MEEKVLTEHFLYITELNMTGKWVALLNLIYFNGGIVNTYLQAENHRDRHEPLAFYVFHTICANYVYSELWDVIVVPEETTNLVALPVQGTG